MRFIFLINLIRCFTYPHHISHPHIPVPPFPYKYLPIQPLLVDYLLYTLRLPSFRPDIQLSMPWEFWCPHHPAIRQKGTLVPVLALLVWIYFNIFLICHPTSCPCCLIPCSLFIMLKPKSDKSHILLTERSQAHK